MDDLDYKLLYQLDNDARLPITELARRLGVSKQTIDYRLDKLIEEKILLGFISMVDIHRLGFLTHRIYFRYQSVTPEEEKKVIKYLTDHDHTLWVVSIAGIWDVEAVFTARNFIHFNNILKELRLKIGHHISKYNISMSPVSYHLKRDYLVNQDRGQFRPNFYGFEPQPGEWDELDIALLEQMSKNCRQSNQALGRHLGVSYQTVKQRLDKLQKEGVLQCHRIRVDLTKLRRRYYKVLLGLKNLTPEKEAALYHFCAERSFVVYLTEVLGEWQLEIETEVEDQSQITGLLRELRLKFPEEISDYEIIEVTKEHKMNYFPMGEKALANVAHEQTDARA